MMIDGMAELMEAGVLDHVFLRRTQGIVRAVGVRNITGGRRCRWWS